MSDSLNETARDLSRLNSEVTEMQSRVPKIIITYDIGTPSEHTDNTSFKQGDIWIQNLFTQVAVFIYVGAILGGSAYPWRSIS